MDSKFELVARALRNGRTEEWHFGAAAVVTPTGELVGRIGDPELAVFLRSVAKPFQAIPLVLAGGLEKFDLSPADLALICASHFGTPAHEKRAASILERAGYSVEDLQCGTHPPFDRAVRQEMRANGEAPRLLQNNCSGKHAGMFCACRLLDWPIDDYLDPKHPLQQRILDELALCAGVDRGEVGFGVDGCSAPTFSIPLRAAARAYAALVDPDAAGLDAERGAAVRSITAAMTTVPEMVAGPGQFTTRLMEVTGGRLLCKEGAQGYYSVAVKEPEPLGIAVKVADGDLRCRDGVVLDLLRQLGSLSAEEHAELDSFRRVPVKSVRGDVVGEILPEVELHSV